MTCAPFCLWFPHYLRTQRTSLTVYLPHAAGRCCWRRCHAIPAGATDLPTPPALPFITCTVAPAHPAGSCCCAGRLNSQHPGPVPLVTTQHPRSYTPIAPPSWRWTPHCLTPLPPHTPARCPRLPGFCPLLTPPTRTRYRHHTTPATHTPCPRCTTPAHATFHFVRYFPVRYITPTRFCIALGWDAVPTLPLPLTVPVRLLPLRAYTTPVPRHTHGCGFAFVRFWTTLFA